MLMFQVISGLHSFCYSEKLDFTWKCRTHEELAQRRQTQRQLARFPWPASLERAHFESWGCPAIKVDMLNDSKKFTFSDQQYFHHQFFYTWKLVSFSLIWDLFAVFLSPNASPSAINGRKGNWKVNMDETTCSPCRRGKNFRDFHRDKTNNAHSASNPDSKVFRVIFFPAGIAKLLEVCM